ncbi:MAG: response regulator [Acidobacteriota bacterium]|nr:response regulator [Acidobacteriota bacterium]
MTTSADSPRGEGTVLLVDDEPVVRTVAQRMLEHLGFEVRVATDGREALDVFREHADSIRLVILDLAMPEIGGEEAFTEMRRIRSDVPVIMSSGYDEQEVSTALAGKGLTAFIQKPYRLAALQESVRAALEEPQSD